MAVHRRPTERSRRRRGAIPRRPAFRIWIGRSVLCGFASTLFVAGSLAVQSWNPASAAQPDVHADNVYYVETSSSSAFSSAGSGAGASDHSGGYGSRITILDFGAQTANGSEAETINAIYMATSTIKALAEAYAAAYYAADQGTAFNYVAIGTNNSVASGVSATTGASWATMVNALNAWASSNGYSAHLAFSAADDIEPSWGGTNSKPDAVAWSNAYDSTSTGGYMFDYGSADGCPQTTHNDGDCNNGWTQKAEYNVSYGTTDALPLPEIYHTTQAAQWTQISWWAHTAKGSYYITGPLSEHPLDSTTLGHGAAWDALSNDLDAQSVTAETMEYDAIMNSLT